MDAIKLPYLAIAECSWTADRIRGTPRILRAVISADVEVQLVATAQQQYGRALVMPAAGAGAPISLSKLANSAGA
ncbi:MAG TPA: hypothetical protein VNS34_10155 [Rhizobiaceae bacterium]|nr:hypothetical protein [Rhizobiaceae bacterium]